MAVEPVEVEYKFSWLREKYFEVSRLQRDGFLLVKGDPEVWIQSNPADLLSVRFLELNRVEDIGDSIGQLSHLTHLFISWGDIKSLPNSIVSLPNLQRLEIFNCSQLQELPANLGELNSLTFLSLYYCSSIKSLSHSISKLSNLTTFHLSHCELEEFPSNLGDLESLTILSLQECPSIKFLPNSISKLSKLTSLHLTGCESFKELPAIYNLEELILDRCPYIQTLPKGQCNLKKLHLHGCRSLIELPTDLNILQLLKIEDCCSIQSLPKGLTNLQQLHLPLCSKLSLANLIYFPSLCHLTFHTGCSGRAHLEELPANLGGLSELLTLNIKDTDIKWLPWSITKLSKLCLLSLSAYFRLETLPRQLNDSIVISVKDTHIRKTWKQLKTGIQIFSIPVVGWEATNSPSTPGYLRYKAGPGPWIQSNCSHSLVRILDLDAQQYEFNRNIINSIGMLPELTYLYISNGYLYNLPMTLTRLTHLSLFRCDFKSCCDSLGKLSTLQSLTLLNCTNLPAHMDLPVSLTHFALEPCKFDSLPDGYMASMRKLSNLKSLELFGYKNLELSLLDLNLTKLKITNCTIKSLPRCLQHLEIIHSSRDWCINIRRCSDELQVCLMNQLFDLETLSVTCYDFKFLPSIPKHQTLKELQLKDCFNLRKLPPNLDELVELCTLNVSGTRIKSLPGSISKLQKLRHLILPKCFIRKSFPKNFEDRVRVFDDDTDDMYYQNEGYYDSDYGSSEDNEITSGFTEGGDEVVLQGFRHDSVIEQASSHGLLKPLPNSTQVHEGSPFSSRTVPIDNGFSSSQNPEMEIFVNVNKDCVFSNCNEIDRHKFLSSIWSTELEGSCTARIDVVGESTSDARCDLQNQEMETLILRDRDCAIHVADGLAAISSFNIHEGQQNFHNGEMDTINSENEQRSQPCDLIYSVHGESDYYALEDGQDKNPQKFEVKHKKTHKIKVSEESIQQCMSQNMRLEDAAKHLNISRSTMKRKLKDYGIVWQSSRRRMQHQDAKNKKHNMVQLDGPNQDTLSDHALFERNVVNQFSRDAILEEPTVPNQCQMDGHRYVGEHSNNAKEGRSSKTVHQPNEISSTFVVKANFGEDTVKFDFCLSSSIEQLKEEVGKRLELEIGKFKIKYQDDDKEWILMTSISELKDALRLSKSSGSNVVRLLVLSKT